MEMSSWIIQMGPKCHHMYRYKREAETNLIRTRGRRHMETEAEVGVLQTRVTECGSHGKLEQARRAPRDGGCPAGLVFDIWLAEL